MIRDRGYGYACKLPVADNRSVAVKLAELSAEPVCPQCDVGVLRPNCLLCFEDCPRLDVIESYGGRERLTRHIRALFGA